MTSSARDLLSALAASTESVSEAPCSPRQDCHERIKIALFFDGTGNNRDADEAEQKWSNVARLFEAHREQPESGIYRRYISGVGTRLNRRESTPWWGYGSPVGLMASRALRDSPLGGGSTGWGAGSRLESGDLYMNEVLERAFEADVASERQEIQRFSSRNEAQGFADLERTLGNHRLIRSIELSVFGFSRGAALARAFVNRLRQRCSNEGGQLKYQGYPIRFRFVGLFDTVASMGRPAQNDFQEVDLWLPDDVEQCVHFVAAHEFRYSFPVDLIRQNGSYPSGWKEQVIPGAHSDVGGGYTPTNQARTNALARVPPCAMLDEATRAGVALLPWMSIRSRSQLFQKFEIPERTQILYDAYMAEVGSGGGAIERQVQAHVEQWFAYKSAITTDRSMPSPSDVFHAEQSAELQAQIDELDEKIAQRTQRSRFQTTVELMAPAIGLGRQVSERMDRELRQWRGERKQLQDRLDAMDSGRRQVAQGEQTIAEEAAQLRELQDQGQPLVLTKVDGRQWSRTATMAMRPSTQLLVELNRQRVRAFLSSEAQPWMLDAYYGPNPSPEVVEFLNTHVHDSKAAFLGGAEPWSYFRSRGIWESARRD